MRCLGCKAWKDGKCLAGVTPYRSKNKTDGIGCACNTRTVEKLLRQNRKTNADRIRSMTDEELAEWLKKQTCLAHNYGYECADGEPDFPDGLPANYDYLTWLKKEVEDGEQD